MNYREAIESAKKIRCDVCQPVAETLAFGDSPSPDGPGTVLCKEKVVQGNAGDLCFVIDNSDCPLGRRNRDG